MEQSLKRYTLLCLAGLCVAATTACVPKRHFRYNVNDIRPVAATRLTVDLRVHPFSDVRRTVPANAVLFGDTNEPKIDGKRHCVNGEKYYEPGAAGGEVSEAIVAHLARRGLVRSVTVASKGTPAYALKGSVRSLYGVQEYHVGSAIGAGFGAIGAAATAGNKSRGKVLVELTDLSLLDPTGHEVKKLEPISVMLEGALPIDAYCWATYDNVNVQLRFAVEKLAVEVEQALAALTAAPAAPAPVLSQRPAAPSGGETAAASEGASAAQVPAVETSAQPGTAIP